MTTGVDRACVVLNPEAGRGRARRVARRVPAALRQVGLEVALRTTTRPGEERRLAADAAREGWPVVIAAGGDGTVHGVANGILDAGTPTALGVLPLGTGNDFAKLTGVAPGPLETMARRLSGARIRRFDVGQAGGERFTNGLGFGFGPAAVHEMRRLPRLRGFALYLTAVIRTFRSFRPFELTIEAEEHTETSTIMLAEIAIGTTAGGGFRLTPAADPTDGRLDVCIIRKIGVSRFVRYLPRVMRGTHTGLPPVTVYRTTRVTCRGARPLEVHMDGELRVFDTDVVEVTVDPARLPVLCAG